MCYIKAVLGILWVSTICIISEEDTTIFQVKGGLGLNSSDEFNRFQNKRRQT